MKLIICERTQFLDKQGIHLNHPDIWYIQDALKTAEKDGFKTIYCHYSVKGAEIYNIPCGVLNLLLELKATFDIPVEFIHPASIKELVLS